MSASRQKGTAWETAVVRFFREHGFNAERRALAGTEDKGDVVGVPLWALECKAEKQISLSQYLTEAEREAANAGEPFYAAVVKRRMKPVGDGYVVMPLKVFVQALLWRMSQPVEAALEEDT